MAPQSNKEVADAVAKYAEDLNSGTAPVVDGQEQEAVEVETDTGSTEETQQATVEETTGDKDNPSWATILDTIPEELHFLVKPELKKWDQKVNDQFQKIHGQYADYKDLIEEKVDPERISQALWLASEIETNPNGIVQQAIDAFGLDYVLKETENSAPKTADANAELDGEGDEYDGVDITKHPQFVALQNQVKEFSDSYTSDKQAKELAATEKAHNDQLVQLEKDHGKFDPLFVTALMTQGIDGVEAVKQYKTIVNQAAADIAGKTQQPTADAPVVMGGTGGSGSGIPTNPVKLGSMEERSVEKLVIQLLENGKQQ